MIIKSYIIYESLHMHIIAFILGCGLTFLPFLQNYKNTITVKNNVLLHFYHQRGKNAISAK